MVGARIQECLVHLGGEPRAISQDRGLEEPRLRRRHGGIHPREDERPQTEDPGQKGGPARGRHDLDGLSRPSLQEDPLSGQIAGIVEGARVVESARMPETEAAPDLVSVVQLGQGGERGQPGLPGGGNPLTAEVQRRHLDREARPRRLFRVADLRRLRIRRRRNPPFDQERGSQGRLWHTPDVVRRRLARRDDHPVDAETAEPREEQRPGKTGPPDGGGKSAQKEQDDGPSGPPGRSERQDRRERNPQTEGHGQRDERPHEGEARPNRAPGRLGSRGGKIR